MSISQLSKQTYVIDVPTCFDIRTQFHYNYFVPDETISETAGVPKNILNKSNDDLNTTFQQYEIRIPRYVKINWSIPTIKQTNISNNNTIKLIQTNIDKIVYEDSFACQDFVNIAFQNNQFNKEIYYVVSGSQANYSTDINALQKQNDYRTQRFVEATMPPGVNPEFVNIALTQPTLSRGVEYDSNSQNSYIQKINGTKINAQINTRVLSNLLITSKLKSINSNYNDINNILSVTQNIVTSQMTADATINDYEAVLPYVEVVSTNQITNQNKDIELVGFIIDKSELLPTGQVISKESIIIESASVAETFDLNVRYGAYYLYQIRTIYKVYIPALDDSTDSLALLGVLVSSKQSATSDVVCIEKIAPPPPTDMGVVWDATTINMTTHKPGCLMLHWTFPPNSQRDIKYFQILRRKTTNNAFELIKMYDFNDAKTLPILQEKYDNKLVEKINSVRTYFIDHGFTKTSKFIYTLACVDAHGYVSMYGMQLEIWFDRTLNKLQQRFISHSGAPRQYPNLYIENQLFANTITMQNEKNKSLKIYLNPEYYRMLNNDNSETKILHTKQENAKYRLQLINLDNQKEQVVTINIDDPLGVTNSDVLRNQQ